MFKYQEYSNTANPSLIRNFNAFALHHDPISIKVCDGHQNICLKIGIIDVPEFSGLTSDGLVSDS